MIVEQVDEIYLRCMITTSFGGRRTVYKLADPPVMRRCRIKDAYIYWKEIVGAMRIQDGHPVPAFIDIWS